MITIKNRQRKIKIDPQAIAFVIQKMIHVAGYADFDIGVLFTTDEGIRKFNKIYRHKDKPTDILSFPFHHHIKAGQTIVVTEQDEKNLGDIIISLERAMADAKDLKRPLQEHLDILFAHGIAHLLGFDHETEQEYKVMQKKERQLLAAL